MAGAARQWDMHQYEQSQVTTTGEEQRARNWWQPFDEFETFWLIRGKSTSEVQKMWEERLQDPQVGANKVNGQWCIPKFVGVLQDTLASTTTQTRFSRQTTIRNAEENVQLQSEDAQIHRDAAAISEQSVMAEVGRLSPPGHCVSDTMVLAPLVVKPVPIFGQLITRDLKRLIAIEEEADEEFTKLLELHKDTTDQDNVKKKPTHSLDSLRLDAWQKVASYHQSLEFHLKGLIQRKDDIVKVMAEVVSEDFGADETDRQRAITLCHD